MNNIFGNLTYVCGGIWGSIGIAQPVSIVLIGFCGVLVIGVVMYLGTRPNWQMLYANLDSKTAAEIYELAKDNNVPVRLKNSGRTILIPFEHVNDLRLKVAKSHCPVESRGVGLELFDDVKLGLAELQRRAGYQRALQGELPRMTGPRTLARIRKLYGDVPAIIITGYPDSALMFKALEYGPVLALVKPVSKQHLLAALRTAVGQERGRESAVAG